MESNNADMDFLTGIRVVDFTQFEAGPSCTEALAWLGAEVVKIENPRMGDPGRRLHPGKPDNDPYYFHVFNANKKSITLNLKSPRGLALVKDMLRKADVCVENFAPGTIERLGLGYDVVRELNPGIIYAAGEGVRRGQPVRKEPRVRHDRAGLRRHVQRDRRSGRTADAAGHFARRHRHRHADGDHHPGRAAQARGDRPGPPAAGGDAGRDHALHAHQLRHPGPDRQAGAARRQQGAGRQQRADGAVSVQARRAERLRLHHDQPRQSRPLGPAC